MAISNYNGYSNKSNYILLWLFLFYLINSAWVIADLSSIYINIYIYIYIINR